MRPAYPDDVTQDNDASDAGHRKQRGLTSSAIGRTAKLASLPAGYAGRTALGLGKRLAGAPAEAVVTEVQRRTAEQIFSVLGQLKGGAMKLGQAMSIFEAVLPEEFAAPYRETLNKLQDAAPPMPAATVHAQLAAALGENWRDQLVELEAKPAAAASIGQVHRGRWSDGRDVAVKIQYPGSAKALRNDLKQLRRMSRLFGILAPGVDIKALLSELEDRVVEELDYRLEGDAQARFAAAFADDPDIVIPDVVAAHETVLVSTWMDSHGSLAAAQSLDDAMRDHYATLYLRFLISGPARAGMMHSDPHPGNFRLVGERQLGVVDFGAVAHLPDGIPPALGRLLSLGIGHDPEALLHGMRAEGFLLDSITMKPEELYSYLRPMLEPGVPEQFRFSRDWLREQMTRISTPDNVRIGMRINLPREYLLITRVWGGAVGVLGQLGATIPVRSLLTEYLPEFPA